MPSTTVAPDEPKELHRDLGPRQELVEQLKGQTAHIPALEPIFAGWKGISQRHISPFLEPLRQKVDARVQCFNFSPRRLRMLKASDFALFTALWWPDAPMERLETLAYLVIWLFTWDDEIDEPTGTFSEDFAAAQAYREGTLRFVGECLGLVQGASSPQNEIVQSFDVVGAALRGFYNMGQLQRFYDEIARFMAASAHEQSGRLQDRVFSLAEYWSFRLGTSAVYIGTAAGEFSMSSCLPSHIMDCSAMRAVWDETNVMISITNDLLSLRKEMRLGCVDSVVPLTFAATGNLDKAVLKSVGALRASRARFDEAAAALLAREYPDDETRCLVEGFVQVQRSNCVGNLVWSLQTLRYSMGGVSREDGSHSFVM